MKFQINVNSSEVQQYIKNLEQRIKRGMPGLINSLSQTIKSDISAGIRSGLDLENKLFTPLKPSTIHSKRARKYRYPRRALFATGNMRNVYLIERATAENLRARLIVPISRQQIGQYHNEGTEPYTILPRNKKVLGPIYSNRGRKYFTRKVNHPGLPRRFWFGISDRVGPLLFRLQNQFIRRILE